MRPSLSAFAVRSLAARRLRTGLTILGVALGVAAVVATAVNVATTTDSLEDLFANVSGRADLRLEPADRARGLRQRDLLRMREQPEVATAAGSLYVGTRIRGETPTDVTLVGIEPEEDAAVRVYTLESGRLLAGRERGGAVVLGAVAARRQGLEVGDRVTLDIGTEGRDLTLVGLLADRGAGHVNRGDVGYVDLRLARELSGAPGRLDQVDLVLAPEVGADANGVETLRADLAAELGPRYTVTRPGDAGASIAQLLSALHLGLGIFSLVTLFVGALLIYNTFAMTVAERTRELGLLRALGATRRQVVRLVLTEAAVVGLVGTALGVLAGLLLAVPLVRITGDLVGVPLEQFGLPPGGLALAMGIGLVVSLAASAVPAAMAGRVPPVIAMRALATTADDSALDLAPRLGVGVLMLAGATLLVPGLPPAAFFVLCCLGVSLAVPGLLGRLERPVTRAVRAAFGAEGLLGGRSLARSRGRASLTVSVLALGLVFTIAIGALGSTYGAALHGWIERAVGGDLVIESDEGLPPRLDAAVRAVPGVAAVSPTRFTGLKLVGVRRADGSVEAVREDITFQAIDPRTFGQVAGLQPAGDGPGEDEASMLTALAEGGAVLVASVLADELGVAPGDTLLLRTPSGERPFRVAGRIVHFERAGHTLMGSWSDLTRVLRRGRPSAILVKLAPGADLETVEAAILRGPGRGLALTLTRGEDFRREIGRDLDRILLLFRSILAIALVVAGLGVVNTMAMNVLERLREIGMLRAVGMTRRQVARMVLAEAAALSAVGGVVGLAVGLPISWAVVRTMTDATGFHFAYVFPAAAFAGGLVIILVVGQVAAAWPASRAAQVEILEAIRHE